MKQFPVFALIVSLSVAPAVAGPFVQITADQFTLDGKIYKLKGTNYYPRDYMWANMWSSWNWTVIQNDVARIRAAGLNCVRILVPYSKGGWNGANVPASRLQMLEDLVNKFGENGVRSNITLFDWETSFPAAGTSTERNHITHLNAIVTRLKDNPYVLMWDVKNEPDHPDNYGWCDCSTWRCGNWDCNPAKRNQIVSWLSRMCAAVRARDPNHPVSAGMRWWENVEDVIGFCDVAIFHSYWPNIGTEEIPVVKGYMGANQKPIVVQEWGWPSNPTPCNRDGQLIYDYNEAVQMDVYVNHLTAFQQHGIAGGLQWMTYDAKPYTSNSNESFEQYFGLWYYNYTLKPAGIYYRDNFPVERFPVPSSSPPAPVSSFVLRPENQKTVLTWQTPASPNFVATTIRYSTTGYPQTPEDGTLLLDQPGDPNTIESFEHIGLTNAQTYYYVAFARDDNPVVNYASGIARSGVPTVRPDIDFDGDVDQIDFGLLQACMTGTGVPQNLPHCGRARIDDDDDVDQMDVHAFLQCLGAPSEIADPACSP